jgi:hypothetical protein
MSLIGILGPEFLLVIASGQFSSALRATDVRPAHPLTVERSNILNVK